MVCHYSFDVVDDAVVLGVRALKVHNGRRYPEYCPAPLAIFKLGVDYREA